MEHFNGPKSKFIRDSLYKHPVDIILDILDMLDIPNCRDGAMFRHILNFMRTGRPMLPEAFDQWDLLLEEARYYELTGERIFCVKY